MRRKTPAEYLADLRDIARERSGVLLSRRYRGDAVKLRWRCGARHAFLLTPSDAKQGSWCRRCAMAKVADRRRARTVARVLAVVASRGGRVVSSEYPHAGAKMRFRCAHGHVWQVPPVSVIQGSWCAQCADRERREHPERVAGWTETKRRIESAVRRQGGEILEPGYRNYRVHIMVSCRRGHTWSAPPRSIEDGVWCPRCREEALLAEFRGIAARHGGRLLSERCNSSTDRLQWQCSLGHQFRTIAHVVRAGVWCRRCRSLVPNDLDRMRRMAHERGGECLSDAYVDAATHLQWRCRDGHEWRATSGEIVKGHWCPECARWAAYSRAQLSIEDMRETAAQRGGTCVSKVYHGNKVRLKWRCARGHEWMAHPNRIRQGSWCPVCAHSIPGTIEGMRIFALERGGRCVSRSWDDHMRPLRFECASGHRFALPGSAVKSGVWCARCAAERRRGDAHV